MAKPIDAAGKTIHIKDTIVYEKKDLMGENIEAEGIVVGILPDSMLLVQTDDQGIPIDLSAESVKVKNSLIQDILSLKTDKEFQDMMSKVEGKFRKLCEETAGKRTRNPRAGGTKSKVKEEF